MRKGPTVKSEPVPKPWDRFPLAEKRIVWTSNRTEESGAVSEHSDWLLPGSSVKGVLRHRTSFYARLLAGQMINANDRTTIDEASATPADEIRLFGSERGQTSNDTSSRPGCIRIGDARIASTGDGAPKQAGFEHVSIDRFTQGPIDNRLFNENTLSRGPEIVIDIAVDTRRLDNDRPTTLQALRRAIEDLCAGRLALGAASSRGHGIFKGRIEWDDNKAPWGDNA
jgi:CRISPR/Cas system CSM-associated protein Csm3 (group 7 of RAMP superfamily)